MKNIKIEGLDENDLGALTIQKLTRIENGINNPVSKVATKESRSKGGQTNKQSGHISNLGKQWGVIQGKKNTILHSTKVLGAKAMKEKSSEPIIQMDMDGNVVKEWDSINSAKNSKEKYHAGHISECCNGLKLQYRGYMWKFKN